jgi:hypothetical protein
MIAASERLRIVVTGLIAQHPGLSGVAWDYLQYPVGLARLGHDVYYLEDSGEWPYLDNPDSSGSWTRRDPTYNLAYLHKVLSRFDMGERWMYRFPVDGSWHGLSQSKRSQILETADLLINVSGTIEDLSPYASIPRRVYIDSDPVFTQLKLDDTQENSAFKTRFDMHNVYFSFGERIKSTKLGSEYDWLPTRQPVLIDQWLNGWPPGEAFTTIMNWTSYPPIRRGDTSYGQKDVQLLKISDLPTRVYPQKLTIAMNSTVHRDWQLQSGSVYSTPQDLLESKGWKVLDAKAVMSTIDQYRNFIHGSLGEFSVAKQGYVVGASGWFSCRSACYLASSRPVIVEDTGFTDILPTGQGLLAFRNEEEAIHAIDTVRNDPASHAEAAYEIASEYFDHERVLRSLIHRTFLAAE